MKTKITNHRQLWVNKTYWDCATNCPYFKSGDFFKQTFSKYVTSTWSEYWEGEGEPDEKTVLDPEDDVAHILWGYGWHIPTMQEWDELENNCDIVWTSDYNGTGKGGYLVTSKVEGYGDRYIFLPAAGNRDGYSLDDSDECFYWSSSMSTYYVANCAVCFISSESPKVDRLYRKFGASIRPVF